MMKDFPVWEKRLSETERVLSAENPQTIEPGVGFWALMHPLQASPADVVRKQQIGSIRDILILDPVAFVE
jgi:hypothetical protein